MAGLTKEQRAAREAEKQEAEQAESHDDGLVAVTKDGETLRVHPTALKQHQQLGWKVV